MDNEKNTSKSLTTDDIRKHAPNWTLAGDVGLLAHLEEFFQDIECKTQESQKYFDELLEDYKKAYTKVDNITNQFLSLQNCQFVENRVYDEETPTEEKIEVKSYNEAEHEKLLLAQYKEAVEVGVQILDTHFQIIQLPPNSDSDEEEEEEHSGENSIIWRPKNPYADKKFPFLIGSAEWWADDNVGLVSYQGNIGFEKIISESDTDSIKSLEKKPKSSSSSSMENIQSIPAKSVFLESSAEDLFGMDRNEIVQNDTCDEFSSKPINCQLSSEKESESKGENEEDLFGINNIPQTENDIESPKVVDNAFTRELVAKLATVKSENKEECKKNAEGWEDNLVPSQEPAGESIFDETGDTSDLFSDCVRGKPLGDRGFIFNAENEDELFAGSNNIFSGLGSDLFKSNNLNESKSEAVRKETQTETKPLTDPKSNEKRCLLPKRNFVDDLFQGLDDGDTLFASNHKSSPLDKSNPDWNPSNPAWENDEGLFESINTDVDDFLNHTRLCQAEPKESKHSEEGLGSKVKKEVNADLRSNVTQLDSESDKVNFLEGNEDEDLFSTGFIETKKAGANSPDEERTSLFPDRADKTGKQQTSPSISSSRSSLFDDATTSKSRLVSVFNKDKDNGMADDLFSGSNDCLFYSAGKTDEGNLFETETEKQMSSLFGEPYDCDDLFRTSKKEEDDVGEKLFFEKPESNDKKSDVFGGGVERKLDVGPKSFLDDLADDDLFKAPVIREKNEITETQKIQTKTLEEAKRNLFLSSEGNLFTEEMADRDETWNTVDPTVTQTKSQSILTIKQSGIESSKSAGKLNIPVDLKLKLENAAQNISSGRGMKVAELKSDCLDDSVGPSANLLKCPSKDRARIPGRRRPQSRRARQEAIRNSDVHWEHSNDSTVDDSGLVKIKASLPSPNVSNPLSPSTDEEDFFNVPELDTNLEEEDQSIFKSNLFQSASTSKSEDNLLFDGAPVLSPVSLKTVNEPDKERGSWLFSPEAKRSEKIFDDDVEAGDDENLFKSGEPREVARDSFVSHSQTKKSPAKQQANKSLFEADLDAEDDDLFRGLASTAPSNIKVPDAEKKKKENVDSKQKINQSFVDPLGLMSEKE